MNFILCNTFWIIITQNCLFKGLIYEITTSCCLPGDHDVVQSQVPRCWLFLESGIPGYAVRLFSIECWCFCYPLRTVKQDKSHSNTLSHLNLKKNALHSLSVNCRQVPFTFKGNLSFYQFQILNVTLKLTSSLP